MRLTAIHVQTEQKQQDRSARCDEKHRCRDGTRRVRGLVRPVSVACATADAAQDEKRLSSRRILAILASEGTSLGERRLLKSLKSEKMSGMRLLILTAIAMIAGPGLGSAQSALERVLGQIDGASNLAQVNGTYANIAESIGQYSSPTEISDTREVTYNDYVSGDYTGNPYIGIVQLESDASVLAEVTASDLVDGSYTVPTGAYLQNWAGDRLASVRHLT